MSNTITAFFKGRIGVAEAVYQNDYGIIMNFDSIELPAHFDCYFSVIGEDEAIPGVGADRQVVIPNACLAKAGNVTLHIPLHTGANDSEVEYVVYFKVIGRARPADDGTPVQMSAIERALALLQAPLTNIEEIVNEALAFTGPTLAQLESRATVLESDTANLKPRMGKAESDIDVLEARVDSFTHLTEGSTTGDAELIDGRVGADGVTYGNIGTANRTQFTNLKSALTAINADISYTIESGGYDANGAKSSASGYWQEERTTRFSVKKIKSVKWSFDCATSVTQSGVWLIKWATDGSFVERSQIVEQGAFTHAEGYYTIASNVGYIAFVYGTRGYTVDFDVVANYDIALIDSKAEDNYQKVSPLPQYAIEDGYYDGTTGGKQTQGGYWKEQLTTKVCVDNVKNVEWSYACEVATTQNGISLSKWKKDGTFIGREVLKTEAVFSDLGGIYQVENNVWMVAFHFSTRGYNVDFDINFDVDYLGMKSDITDIQTKLDDKLDVIDVNQDALTKVFASRWVENNTTPPLSLLWFTDPHRKEEPLARINQIKKYLKGLSMLDDTICTGDIVLSSSEETTQFAKYWTDNPDTSDILIACGNHEWYANTSQPHTKMTIAQIDAMYFTDTSDWGITRSGTNPFYYKDYDDQKVRLIVVDPAVTDEEADETTWLEAVLADAITNEYAVIIATHFLRGNLAIYDNNWTEFDKRDLEVLTQGYDWAGCDIIACVAEFISNGGTFICYMQGHTHTDYLAYPTEHPDQLIVSLASASWGRSETPLKTNDLPRYPETRTMDCFNLISVDSNRNILKCIRIGSNVNMLEEPRTAFSYNYETQEFISLI